MEKWVILQHPALLLVYGAALFFHFFDRKYTKAVFPFLTAALAIGATAFLLLYGAQLYEAAGILLVFLLLNMGVDE